MTANDLLESLRDDPDDLLTFALHAVRECPDGDGLEATPVLGVEFDHEDRELCLLVNTSAEGESYLGDPMTVALFASRIVAEQAPVGTYTLFVTSQWSSLPDGYEGRLCRPLQGVVLNRESAVVGLVIDEPDDEKST
jgi:hypothetical protein